VPTTPSVPQQQPIDIGVAGGAAQLAKDQAYAAAQAAQQQAAADVSARAPPPEAIGKILSKEEKVEYRDEAGNILNAEQVKALEGKVSFKTRYETRTRVVDEQGNEVYQAVVDVRDGDDENPAGVAPPHPDVEGRNPETGGVPAEAEANTEPATASADVGGEAKEEKPASEQPAKPASEAPEATKGEL